MWRCEHCGSPNADKRANGELRCKCEMCGAPRPEDIEVYGPPVRSDYDPVLCGTTSTCSTGTFWVSDVDAATTRDFTINSDDLSWSFTATADSIIDAGDTVIMPIKCHIKGSSGASA